MWLFCSRSTLQQTTSSSIEQIKVRLHEEQASTWPLCQSHVRCDPGAPIVFSSDIELCSNLHLFSVLDAAFWIVPSRLQLFEYEALSLKCTGFDDLTGWNILRRAKTEIAACGLSKWGVSTESSCSILGAFPDDSGEYWCEAGGGKRSNSVNITVTSMFVLKQDLCWLMFHIKYRLNICCLDGSVILESPVLPVMEGEAVLLRCRTKTTSSNLKAGFYKDGLLIGNSSTGDLIILRISQNDDGLYKCKISDVGESPESRLTVRGEAPNCFQPDCL